MRKWLGLFLIIGLVVTADQYTKHLVMDNLRLHETRAIIPALSPFFQITRSQNSGAVLGILPEASSVFLVLALVVVVAMVYFYPRIPEGALLTRLAIGLICGGALGNALDRLSYDGHVIDFIHYQIPGLISNVSNLADHALVGGVIVLFIDSWRQERTKHQQPSAETPEDLKSPENEGN